MSIILQWLKWRIAGREMAELERWRLEWYEHRRWLAEFPGSSSVLDRIKHRVDEKETPTSMYEFRDSMRCRGHS